MNDEAQYRLSIGIEEPNLEMFVDHLTSLVAQKPDQPHAPKKDQLRMQIDALNAHLAERPEDRQISETLKTKIRGLNASYENSVYFTE